MYLTAFFLRWLRSGERNSVPLARRLVEAVAWCEKHARVDDPAGSLRTILRRTLPSSRADDVDWIVSERSRAFHPTQLRDVDWKARGRLLVYFPDRDTACGGALSTSDGYFDWNAAPPWDTWLALGDLGAPGRSDNDFLLAWVPGCFVELAAKGIWADPMDSVQWLDDAESALRDAVDAELR
jgi:hypothetical protein